MYKFKEKKIDYAVGSYFTVKAYPDHQQDLIDFKGYRCLLRPPKRKYTQCLKLWKSRIQVISPTGGNAHTQWLLHRNNFKYENHVGMS